MIPRDDELPAGVPRQALRTAPAAATVVTPAVEEPREGEGAAVPRQSPVFVRAVTPEDEERHRRAQQEEEEAEARRIEEEHASDATLLNLPALVAHPLLFAVLVGLAALLGLFVFGQIAVVLTSFAALPPVLYWLGCTALAVLFAGVLFAAGRVLLFYLSLPASKPVRLAGLAALSQRTHLRWLVLRKKTEAKAHLEAYLTAYPLEKLGDRKRLATVGVSEKVLSALETGRRDLLDGNRFSGCDDWFVLFRERFQTPLDGVAAERIACYARRAGVLTAVSPNTLIDTLVTAYCGFCMLGDLCRVYHLRVGRMGTAVLLARIFFNAYLAGQLNEWEDVTGAGIENVMTESGLHLGSVAADATAAKVLGKVGARAASGALNYFLLKRLGQYAVRLLRPVQAP